MKKLLILAFVFFLVLSCKPCRECKYSTLKGVERETFCSSIKADRISFEQKWDSIAKVNGSKVVCTKETY